jgi:hypothetical protein
MSLAAQKNRLVSRNEFAIITHKNQTNVYTKAIARARKNSDGWTFEQWTVATKVDPAPPTSPWPPSPHLNHTASETEAMKKKSISNNNNTEIPENTTMDRHQRNKVVRVDNEWNNNNN